MPKPESAIVNAAEELRQLVLGAHNPDYPEFSDYLAEVARTIVNGAKKLKPFKEDKTPPLWFTLLESSLISLAGNLDTHGWRIEKEREEIYNAIRNVGYVMADDFPRNNFPEKVNPEVLHAGRPGRGGLSR